MVNLMKSGKWQMTSAYKKRLRWAILIVLLFQHPLASLALEGFIKFPGKKLATVKLEIADTDAKRSKGLMNREKLENNRGMVFVFRPKRKVTFWMKDTLISLDMIFIDKGKIVKVIKDAIPNQIDILYHSDFEVTEVVEVNSGFVDTHMINVGDRIKFKNIAQIDYSTKSMLMITSK